jgi:hypothetical protein
VATTNYNFLELTGDEIAGYNSINDLIESIDAQLDAHFQGMIVLMRALDSVPAGWQEYNVTNYPPPAIAPPTPPADHKYIIKI